MVCAYNPSTRETEAEGHEFQVSLCYPVGPCLTKHLIILRGEGEDSLGLEGMRTPVPKKVARHCAALTLPAGGRRRWADLGSRQPSPLGQLSVKVVESCPMWVLETESGSPL